MNLGNLFFEKGLRARFFVSVKRSGRSFDRWPPAEFAATVS